MRRGPALVVTLCATVVALVILAAAGNQWVVDHLVKNETARELQRNRELKATLTAFPWRWTWQPHQRMLWLGEIVSVVGLIVVTFLLLLAYVAPTRTPRHFVPAFLGTWGIVVGLTQVAAIGRTMLAYGDLFPHSHDRDGLGRWWYSVFRGPTAETMLFGGASGLIVAIVTGILAATTGRRAAEEAEPELDTTATWASHTVGGAGTFATDTASDPPERSWSTPTRADASREQQASWPSAKPATPAQPQPLDPRSG